MAILHIDGDSFFASVEISLNPALRGKPVVTGEERGIATAMSREAKALGVHRGMPVYQIRKLYPQAVIVQSSYHHYGMYAHRMYNIVRRYSPVVEEYSVDECFADLTGLSDPVAAARQAKADLQKELGITFSLGLAPTKVLAKVASKWNKPDGFTVLEPADITNFLQDLHVGKVWGIGPASSRHLGTLGIKTALDLVSRPREWVESALGKRELELWHELRGEPIYSLHDGVSEDDLPGSIQKTRTWKPPTADKNFILSELSYNLEAACAHARAENLLARRVYYFIKTQEFRYYRHELALPQALSTPSEIMGYIRASFHNIYRPGSIYRASGITLSELIPKTLLQNDLFGEGVKNDISKEIFQTVDKLDRRFGSHTVVLGSSLHALKRRGKAARTKHFNLPFMGEVL